MALLSNAAKTNLLESYPRVHSVGESKRDGEPIIVLSIPHGATTTNLPETVEGYRTEIAEREPETRHSGYESAHRPVQPGLETSNKDIDGGNGSIGYVMRDGNDYYITSNFHVWDSDDGKVGDRIIQPGFGNADENDVVAHFAGSKYFHQADVDLAWARLSAGVSAKINLYKIGARPKGKRDPIVGWPVVKSGQRTGVTTGEITETGVSLRASPNAVAHNQFRCTPMSNHGDSGSAIMTNDGNNDALGLVWGGGGETTLCCPIDAVESASGLTLVTADDVDGHTYQGLPRDAYRYCGDAAGVYNDWRAGRIDTTQFARRTPRGHGTASLTLGDCWNGYPKDQLVYCGPDENQELYRRWVVGDLSTSGFARRTDRGAGTNQIHAGACGNPVDEEAGDGGTGGGNASMSLLALGVAGYALSRDGDD